MKKFIIILAFITFIITLSAQENWQVYTNTSHVNKVFSDDNKLFSISWGGIETYNYDLNSTNEITLDRHYTTIDGLIDNEIVCALKNKKNIWLGTYANGLSIIKPNGIFNVQQSDGLPSNKITSIIQVDELTLVGTDTGFSSFYELEEISIPLLGRIYNTESTNGTLLSNNIIDFALINDWIIIISSEGINYVQKNKLNDYSAWKTLEKNQITEIGFDDILRASSNDSKIVIDSGNALYSANLPKENDSWEWTKYDIKTQFENTTTASNIDDNNNLYFSLGNWDFETSIFSDLTDSRLGMFAENGTYNELLNVNNDKISKVGIKNINIKNDEIYLSTWGEGFYILKNKILTNYKPNGIGFNSITDLSLDKSNKLWACCGYPGASPLRKGAKGVSSFDGVNWVSYNMQNSHLTSDNVNSITVANDNTKYFGSWYASSHVLGWKGGVVAFNEDSDLWRWYHTSGVWNYDEDSESYSDLINNLEDLQSQTAYYLNTDKSGNIMMSLSGYGLAIYSPDGLTRVGGTPLPNSNNNNLKATIHSKYGYFLFKLYVSNPPESDQLLWWNSDVVPGSDNSSHWKNIPPFDVRSARVYKMLEIETRWETQLWFATNVGLIMYNGNKWYKYGNTIKRRVYNGSWQVETRYFVGEPKLFAAQEATPTTLAFDGNNLWIGSDNAGICSYNVNTENFTTYTKENYPLISNNITDLEYEPTSGKLYIGASDGLCSLNVGSQINKESNFNNVQVVPNPFYPEQDQLVRIINYPKFNMPNSAKSCKIYDFSGQLIISLSHNQYNNFEWNGNNKDGKKCSSGIYFYVISAKNGETVRGKIALIR